MTTKSWRRSFRAATYDRKTSTRRMAFRSDWNRRFPMLVLVVVKKTRDELSMFSGLALRAGIAIAGAKAQFLPPNSPARLKPCPDTKPHLNTPYTSLPSFGVDGFMLVACMNLARLHVAGQLI